MPLQLVWLGLKKYFSTVKKIFVVFITFVVIFQIFAVFVQADRKRDAVGKPTVAQVEEARRQKLYARLSEANDPKNDDSQAIYRGLQRLLLCKAAGELCTDNPSEAHLYQSESWAYQAGGLIAMPLTKPPSSFYYWARDTLENAGFVPKTYAATGIGFSALTSFQPLWKVLRDLSYLIIVIVVVVVGFLVMFNIGGGGKTAVTLESALPRFVLALLSISFSYAIAGLLVDMMYISIAMIINYFGPIAGLDNINSNTMINNIITGTPTDLGWQILFDSRLRTDAVFMDISTALFDLLPPFIQHVIGGLLGTFMIEISMLWGSAGTGKASVGIKKIMSGILAKAAKAIPKITNIAKFMTKDGGGIMGLSIWGALIMLVLSFILDAVFRSWAPRYLLSLILMFGMVAVIFNILITLIKVYIDIFLSIIFSPMILMLGAIPGQKGLGEWIKGLAVNLAVFPLTILLFIIGRVIINNSYDSAPIWSPPFVNVIPDQSSLQIIVGGILIYSVPQIIKAFRQQLGAKSLTSSMNLGVGALFVGATPLIKGGSTMLGASGIGGALAKRVTKPFSDALGLTLNAAGNLVPKSGGSSTP